MSILNCLDYGAVARSSLTHLGQLQRWRQKVRCILLISSSRCFSTQLNSRQWCSFARSIGSILCKTHFFAFWSIFLPMPNLYFALLFYFYIIAKNSLPGSWRASLSQVVAAYLHCSCCISHAFPEAAFFFFFNQTENLYLFFCNHRGHLNKIFSYVSLQFKSGASLDLL